MKQMKTFIIGVVTGAILMVGGTSFAATAIQEVKAFLRPDFTVQVDGKKAKLTNTPLIYEGSSYLPVREIAGLLGKEVDFKDGLITLQTRGVISMGYESLRTLAIRDGINLAVFKDIDFTSVSSNANDPTVIDTTFGVIHVYKDTESTYVNISDWDAVVSKITVDSK